MRKRLPQQGDNIRGELTRRRHIPNERNDSYHEICYYRKLGGGCRLYRRHPQKRQNRRDNRYRRGKPSRIRATGSFPIFLRERPTKERMIYRPKSFYEDNGVTPVLGVRATEIDPRQKQYPATTEKPTDTTSCLSQQARGRSCRRWKAWTV